MSKSLASFRCRFYSLPCYVFPNLVFAIMQRLLWSTCAQFRIGAFHNMMDITARRVASKRMIAIRRKAAKEAEKLCAAGECAAALVLLRFAIYLGDLPSRALMAWLLIDGRKGVEKDRNAALKLVEEGVLLGCRDCKGLRALDRYFLDINLYFRNPNKLPIEKALELALKSSEEGSKYGDYVLAGFYQFGIGGLRADSNRAAELYQQAAVEGFDGALVELGSMCSHGIGGPRDDAKALRLIQLAAAQGNPRAFYELAYLYEKGRGVAVDVTEAIRWYRRALAAGERLAVKPLQSLERALAAGEPFVVKP